jgi:hypothetical protein
MTKEISEEAKRALADLPRRRAFVRLEPDGPHSTAAVQRRVRALAHERNIPPADFTKLMYKRINTRDIMAFCEKHKVNYDCLLGGNLAGLQQMMREHKARVGGPDDKWVKFLSAALEAIPPHLRLDAIEGARKIAQQPGSAGADRPGNATGNGLRSTRRGSSAGSRCDLDPFLLCCG